MYGITIVYKTKTKRSNLRLYWEIDENQKSIRLLYTMHITRCSRRDNSQSQYIVPHIYA